MTNIADRFRNCLSAELRLSLGHEPALAGFIAELDGLDCSSPWAVQAKAVPDGVSTHLVPALEATGCAEPLAGAVSELADGVSWYQIFEGDGIEPGLARGLAAAQLAGQVGVVRSATIRTGLFLLAPGIHYPLHQHAAHEIYFVVSGSLTLQHGRTGAPFRLEPGQCSVTPPNRLHALTSHETPCLVIYAWIGEVDAPNWWWEQDAQGHWTRVCWERQPDASWMKTRTEPVDDEILRQAGEA